MGRKNQRYAKSASFIKQDLFRKRREDRCLNCIFATQTYIRMSVVDQIKSAAAQAIKELFQININDQDVLVNNTKPDFEGDYTVVLFTLVKSLRKAPEVLGNDIGSYLVQKHPSLIFQL